MRSFVLAGGVPLVRRFPLRRSRRRAAAGVCLALLVVLAGCSVGFTGSGSPSGTETETATVSPTPTPASGPAPTTTPDSMVSPPDPETDRLGWEAGYWANETLRIDRGDGLNETEREAVVARAMARVELVRQLEFREPVPLEIVSRAEYRNRSAGQPGEISSAFRRFDNAKFEATFLVGEDNDSLAVQDENRGASVLGFYSPENDTIVVVTGSDVSDLPGERTLAHELVHAVQDQHFDLTSYRAPTRMQYNAQNGLIEGDANFVQYRYEERCSEEWECLAPPAGDGDGGSPQEFHLGIYILEYFPYSDGPGFVGYYERRGGWDRVNELYAAPPSSDAYVISPGRYGSGPPADVALDDRASDDWTRLRPEARTDGSPRPDYASMGQSGLTAMFAYTLYDDQNQSSVVEPSEFLNLDGNRVNRTDPFDYDLAYTSGYENDRLHVYEKDGETGYVWRIRWSSPEAAAEFADGYGRLLDHYGADPVAGGGGNGTAQVYRVDRGPFADAFRVTVEGDTVTVVNAPTTDALDGVRGGGA